MVIRRAVWGTAAKSNIEILQRQQNTILRKMVGVPWYFRNDQLHQEMGINTVGDEIKKLARSYERRLHNHPNIAAIELLADPPVRRLKRNVFTDI